MANYRAEMTIGQVARHSGLQPSAIRYYESIDLFPSPRRVGGQRRYEPEIVERLEFIQVAQRLGFTLTEIRLLFHNREEETPLSDRWRELASQKLREVETTIRQALAVQRLLKQGLHCGCVELFDCMECIVRECDGEEPASAAMTVIKQ